MQSKAFFANYTIIICKYLDEKIIKYIMKTLHISLFMSIADI